MSLDAFLQGVIAGYGIAIPIGPIGIIILELGTRRGFRVAFFAGLGTASADLIYATIASLAGTFLAQILAPFALLIRVVSAAALIALGLGYSTAELGSPGLWNQAGSHPATA